MPGNVSVRSGPAPASTHDISFSDGSETWGAILDNGPRGVQEVPQTPSTLVFNSGNGRYGDNQSGLSHLEQSDWTGGRGQEYFANDNTRYFDSQNLWSLSPDMLMSGLQWKLIQGLNSSYVASGLFSLPGNVNWQVLTGNQRYKAVPFTPTANTDVDAVNLWVRRRGRPGTLTMEVRNDNSGHPGTVRVTGTATASDITDYVSVFYGFDFSGTTSLTGGTQYWIAISGGSTDDANNHWEVGVQVVTNGGKNSATGPTASNWNASDGPPYFYCASTAAGTGTTNGVETLSWKFFSLEGTQYVVQYTPPGIGLSVTSSLFRQGDRGECDSNSGDKTKVNDATKSWATNVWAGAKVKIVAGPGQGEWRTISSNTGTALTVSPAFTIAQTTSSRYTIYDTPYWMDLTASLPANATVTDVAVIDNLAFFACGTNEIFQMRNNSTGAEQFDTTDSNTAWLLKVFYHPDDGVQLWRSHATSSDISRAVPSTYGGASMTFGTAIPIGEDSAFITNLVSYDDELWVLKEDSLWRVKNDRPSKLDVGLDAAPALTNGLAACTQDNFLYFSWSFSVERLYGGTLDDMGPWKGAGLPTGRTGTISALLPVFGWLFAAVDGGPSGTSSILVWNKTGWHEVFRGWEVGRRIRSLYWQPVLGGQPKLFFSFGRLIGYVTFPQDGLHPLRDTSLTYQHESVLVTSTYDQGTLRLPKFIKEFEAVLDNLGRASSAEKGREVYLDFQIDDQIGTARWTPAAILETSPVDTVQLNLASIRAIRFRLRINTGSATVPIVLRGTIVECFARTPVKYQYNVRVKVSSLQRNFQGQPNADPDAFVDWLKQQAGSAGKVRVRSQYRQWDDKLVIIEPPTVIRSFQNRILGWWGGVLVFTVRDV